MLGVLRCGVFAGRVVAFLAGVAADCLWGAASLLTAAPLSAFLLSTLVPVLAGLSLCVRWGAAFCLVAALLRVSLL